MADLTTVRPALHRSFRPGSDEAPVVLVVGFPNSVHTARWINMVQGRGIRFVVVPSYDAPVSTEFHKTSLIREAADLHRLPHDVTPIFDIESVGAAEIDDVQSRLDYHEWRPSWLGPIRLTHPAHVVAAVLRLRPVLVHSMVVQFGGYLCFAAKEYLGSGFPPWLLSNWGSDIYLFRMLPDHAGWLEGILSQIDAYHAECDRDVQIARDMGFTGFCFPALPATGGMDFSTFPALDAFKQPSERREILIKGYHGWSGRGMHILSAVHLAADVLRPFTIRLTLAGPEVQQMAMAMREWDELDIIVEPYMPDHRDALGRLANCRAVIGLGISDGISTTLLEAMAVGAFPIQGSCSCGNEWITPNETGILVSPDDINGLAEAIRRVATDDAMVNAAASRNREAVERRWSAGINGDIVMHNYRSLLRHLEARRAAVQPLQ